MFAHTISSAVLETRHAHLTKKHERIKDAHVSNAEALAKARRKKDVCA
jgi:hypothetical protein